MMAGNKCEYFHCFNSRRDNSGITMLRFKVNKKDWSYEVIGVTIHYRIISKLLETVKNSKRIWICSFIAVALEETYRGIQNTGLMCFCFKWNIIIFIFVKLGRDFNLTMSYRGFATSIAVSYSWKQKLVNIYFRNRMNSMHILTLSWYFRLYCKWSSCSIFLKDKRNLMQDIIPVYVVRIQGEQWGRSLDRVSRFTMEEKVP